MVGGSQATFEGGHTSCRQCQIDARKSDEGQTGSPEAAGRARDRRSRPAGLVEREYKTGHSSHRIINHKAAHIDEQQIVLKHMRCICPHVTGLPAAVHAASKSSELCHIFRTFGTSGCGVLPMLLLTLSEREGGHRKV